MPDDIEPAAEEEDVDLAAEPEAEPLPEHKADLVALAIDRKIPSYEAWDMTVDQLKETLRG